MNRFIKTGVLMISASASPLMAAEGWTGFYVGGQIGSIDTEMSYYGLTATERSRTYGLLAGYNYSVGSNFVIGAELNCDRLDYSTMPFGSDVATRRIKARLGYDLGPVMLYGTYGYADIGDATGQTENGTSVSIGADYKATDSIIIGAELLRDSFEYKTIELDITSVRLRVSYQF